MSSRHGYSAIIVAFFSILASWAVSSAITKITHLPAIVAVISTILMSVFLLFVFRQWFTRLIIEIKTSILGSTLLLLLVIVLVILTSIVGTSNLDDFNYLSITNGYDGNVFSPLPDSLDYWIDYKQPHIPMHVFTNYEGFYNIFLRSFGLDSTELYFNSHYVVSIVLISIYFSLLRFLGFGRLASIAGSFFVIAYLYYDIAQPVTGFGNYTIHRFWQGKALLVSIAIPATIYATLKVLRRPTYRNSLFLLLVGIGSVSLSSTGIFIFPVAVAAVTVSYYIGYGFKKNRLWRFIKIVPSAIYIVIVAGNLYLNNLNNLFDSISDFTRWPDNWYETIIISFGSPDMPLVFWRNVLLPFLVPLLCLPWKLSRWFVLYSVFIFGLFMNPVMGPISIKFIPPIVYWRVFYLLPIPLMIGVVVAFVVKSVSFTGRAVIKTQNIIRLLTSLGIVVLLVFSYMPVITKTFTTPPRGKTFKGVFDSRIFQVYTDAVDALNKIKPEGEVARVIAPPLVAGYASIKNPDMKFLVVRPNDIRIYFTNDNKQKEGTERLRVNKSIIAGPANIKHVKRLRKYLLKNKIDLLVVPEKSYKNKEKLYESLLRGYDREANTGDYYIYKRKPGPLDK